MSALPPWVIEDKTASPLQVLAPTGWIDCVIGDGATKVSSRGQALSFYTEVEALAWILDVKRFTPGLLVGRTAVPAEREHKPTGVAGSYISDYEPFALGAV